MPIGEEHVEKMKRTLSDLTNAAVGRAAGSCTAAAFLSQFIEPLNSANTKNNNTAQGALAVRGAANKQNKKNKKNITTSAKGEKRGRPPKMNSRATTTTSRNAGQQGSRKRLHQANTSVKEEY